MITEENFSTAITELRKSQENKRNFNQSIDLIINLKNFDVRREAFSLFIQLPNKIKDKKVAGFFEKDSSVVDTIKKDDFPRYTNKKDIKRLIKHYDFFVANAKLMPSVASAFGRFLGPAAKMPSPQLGILPSEDEKMIKAIVDKINSTVRIKIKEPSIKVAIGKESLSDEQILRNVMAVYTKIIETLPRKIDNIRNVKLKLTMAKPVSVQE